MVIGFGSCNKSSNPAEAADDPADVSPASMTGGKPHAVNASQYQKLILDPDRLVVVDFHADWCGPCRQLGPIMDQLAAEFSDKVLFLKVDVDENRVLTSGIGVKSIPDIRMFVRGQQVHHTVGLPTSGDLRNTIKSLMPSSTPDRGGLVTSPPSKPVSGPAPQVSKPSLLDRLKSALPGGSPTPPPGDPAKPVGPDGKEIIPPIRPSKANEEWLPPGMGRGSQPPSAPAAPAVKGK